MVQARTNGNTVTLESTLEITEGQCEKLKKHPKIVKALLNDLHVEHFLSSTEDGKIISKIGCHLNENSDLGKQVDELREKHRSFIREIDSKEENDSKTDNQTNDPENIRYVLLIPVIIS